MTDFDLAIIGSGFGGSLLAMIARRLGLSVVMLEKGKHPRFAIGESSTPLANLLLEEIARKYALNFLLPLTRWGTWQKNHPEIGCGLKRGFTFLHHQLGRRWQPHAERANQLLVAASPQDAVADTHWYRPDFDEFLARRARELGVELIEEIRLNGVEMAPASVQLSGQRANGEVIRIGARFLVDASGPRGYLHRALLLPETRFKGFPETSTLYAHFTNVSRWDQTHVETEPPPYTPDDAALHHVFDGGWIWVLRFNNGVASAGIVADTARTRAWWLAEQGRGWERCLEGFPAIRDQFATARRITPWRFVAELPFRSGSVWGERWALLPSSAGFVDPLLSSGFPLTLLGVLRLGEALRTGISSFGFDNQMRRYERQTWRELDATAALVAALYRNMDDFARFTQISLLYFAAVSFMETARRLDRAELAGNAFLALDHPSFGSRILEILNRERRGELDEPGALPAAVRAVIQPIDVAGLCSEGMRNWYPAITLEKAVLAARKLGADEALAPRLLE